MPSVPTDNLYKFMAIAGVALYVFCLSFGGHSLRELEERQFREREALAVAGVELDQLKADRHRLEAEVNAADNETKEAAERARTVKTKSDIANAKAELRSRVPIWQDKAKDLRTRLRALDAAGWALLKKSAVVGVRVDSLRDLLQSTKAELGLYCFGLITGGILAFSGFRLWYSRLQRHLDRGAKLGAMATNPPQGEALALPCEGHSSATEGITQATVDTPVANTGMESTTNVAFE